MDDAISGALKGAAAGAALGPIGAAVGALLGAAPGALSAIGVHLFDEDTAGKALDVVRAVTGSTAPDSADISKLSSDQRVALQLGMARLAAEQDAEDNRAEQAARAADIEEMRALLADVAGARQQTVALAQTGSRIAWGAPLVSLTVVAIFGAVMALVLFRPLPAGSEQPVNILLGILGAAFGAVVSYWVGSSAGSRDKDATIRQVVTGKTPGG